MQPLADIVKHLPVGAIIYHQPRNHYYQILNKTMIKKGKEGWEYGWCYQEVKPVQQIHDETVYELNKESEIYSRPFSLFDSDWLLAY